MKTSMMDRIGSWSVTEQGLVRFEYPCDGTKFVFYVTRESMRDVMRDIGNLAANPDSPMSLDDAAYLTSLIREVMGMQPQFGGQCDCDQCVQNNRGEIVWQVMMFACSAAAMFTLAVFLLWGAR